MQETEIIAEPLARMSRVTKKSATALSLAELRFLVNGYYSFQESRKGMSNQARSLPVSDTPHHEVLIFMARQAETLELQIRGVLDTWTNQHAPSQWAKSIVGIGPVISAGLAAYIDITQAPTVGHIWRIAGLDPTQKWLGREKAAQLVRGLENDIPELLEKVATVLNVKIPRLSERVSKYGKLNRENLVKAASIRPWNAALKTLCWKIGESFVKVSGNENDFYGKVYLERKRYEAERNEQGLYAAQAEAKLREFNIGKETEAYAAYSSGKLPPAHLHSRAKRYAVKLFLAHYHHVAFVTHYGTAPPKPYIIAHGEHTHFIAPPNYPITASMD